MKKTKGHVWTLTGNEGEALCSRCGTSVIACLSIERHGPGEAHPRAYTVKTDPRAFAKCRPQTEAP